MGLFLLPLFYPNNELASQSYTRLLGLCAGFLLFVSMQQFQFNRTQIQRLLLLIVVAGSLQSCYSLMQDYLLPAGNIFGYNVDYGRPYGIFQQSSVLATFMATTLILAGYLLQQVNNRKIQLFLLFTVALNMWVLTISVSRSGYLGVLIALFLFFPWAWQANRQKLGMFILAILLGLGLAATKGGDVLGKRTINQLTEGGGRLVHYSNSWQMIKQKPLMGYGYGGFQKGYIISTAKRGKNNEPEIANLSHPHNELMFWTVEGGVVPLLAILLLVFAFIHLLRVFKLSHALALMALVIPISVHTQTEYPLYHSALHWLVLLVLVFYIDNESQTIQNERFRLTFALRVFALLIPLVTTLFMLSNLHTISRITAYERSKQPDIELLMDIINPLVFEDRLNFHLNYFRLSMAPRLNKPEEMQKVIDWTESTVETAPKSYFYLLLYLAYHNNNQAEKAQQTLNYARYLFPRDKQLANIDKAVKKTEASASKALPTDNEQL